MMTDLQLRFEIYQCFAERCRAPSPKELCQISDHVMDEIDNAPSSSRPTHDFCRCSDQPDPHSEPV